VLVSLCLIEVYWKGLTKENHVEEVCEQGDELENC
jgi:hypothetical protein